QYARPRGVRRPPHPAVHRARHGGGVLHRPPDHRAPPGPGDRGQGPRRRAPRSRGEARLPGRRPVSVHATATILAVENLYTAYGLSQVLFGVTLEVRQGECVCLLGRNGVGKTTTMRSIIGLTPPDPGRVVR